MKESLLEYSKGEGAAIDTNRRVVAEEHPRSLLKWRHRLSISHYNAFREAFTNLARIDDFDLEELGYGFFSDVFKVR